MNNKPAIRTPEIIQEEINDLHRYLDGIPEKLRANGAFNSYEQRKIELNKELVLSRLYNFYVSTEERSEGDVSMSLTHEKLYPTIEQRLQSLEGLHKRSADRYTSLTQVLQFSLLGGTAFTLAALLASQSVFSVAFGAISAVLATLLSFLRLPKKVREQERLADYFMALRNETANILNTGRDFSSPPRYYENSTKTIEKLIEDIRVQKQAV